MTYSPPLNQDVIPADWRDKLGHVAYYQRGDDLPTWWWEMQDTSASSGALREIAKLEAQVDMLCAQIEEADREWTRGFANE